VLVRTSSSAWFSGFLYHPWSYAYSLAHIAKILISADQNSSDRAPFLFGTMIQQFLVDICFCLGLNQKILEICGDNVKIYFIELSAAISSLCTVFGIWMYF
jgi:hypothetical protein